MVLQKRAVPYENAEEGEKTRRKNIRGIEENTDTCMFCLSSERAARLRFHTIVAAGEMVYFASQTERDMILPFHSLICPAAHVSTVCEIDEKTWNEIRDVKKCYRLMLIEAAEQCNQIIGEWKYGDEEEEDARVESILEEHKRRSRITVEAAEITHIDTVARSMQLPLKLKPVFFEFHLPRRYQEAWQTELSTGAHYTIDCLALSESDFEMLKMSLVNEAKMIESRAEYAVDVPGQRQRVLRKLDSKTFFKREIPRPNCPPPYLYFDFGLEEAYLLIMGQGDMNRSDVRSFVERSISLFEKPKNFDYESYLKKTKALYYEFDCFRPDE